jgi:hypothetical protein
MSKTHSRASRHLRLTRFDLILCLAWLASLPAVMLGAIPDETSHTSKAASIGSLLLCVVVAITAGFRYSRRRDTAKLWTAFVFGSLTISTAASATALAHGTPDVPWGFVVILNALVFTAGTGITIAIGALAGRRRSCSSGTAHTAGVQKHA